MLFRSNISFTEKRSYWKGFVQGNLSYHIQHFEFVWPNRFSWFNLHSQTFDLGYPIETYQGSSSAMLLEEGLKAGAGKKRWQLFLKYEYGIPLAKSDVQWYHSNFQLGFSYHFGRHISNAVN